MLLRLLIMIFALNAFAPPAIAATCDMMGDTHISSMSDEITKHHSANKSAADAEMECNMLQAQTCYSAECMTNCGSSFTPVITQLGDKSFVIKITSYHPKDNLLSLYKIFLPINTPPPLV